MRHVSLLLAATLATLALWASGPQASSHAGQLRCDHKGVSATDVDKLRPVATTTAAGHRLDWSTINGCTHSRGAWAHVDIVTEPQADGSLLHGAAWCQRGKVGAWSCDYASGRALRMTVVVGGQSRELDTNIPPEITVEAARRVMQQAIEVAPVLALEQICDPDGRTIDEWERNALQEIHRDFQFPEENPHARIDSGTGGLVVEIGPNQLYFEPLASGHDSYQFSCWDIAITV